MKKPLLLMSLFLLGTLFIKPAAAQDAGDTTALLLRPHLVKINLTALPLRTFSFQYEHVMGPRITVGGGLRIMPKGGLPLLNSFEKLIDDEEPFRSEERRVGKECVSKC